MTEEESGEKILVDFWDTAGQEKFQSMHPSYYHQVGLFPNFHSISKSFIRFKQLLQAHCAILVFDCTRKNTYKNLSNWYAEMRKFRPSIPALVAVNKIDGKSLE